MVDMRITVKQCGGSINSFSVRGPPHLFVFEVLRQWRRCCSAHTTPHTAHSTLHTQTHTQHTHRHTLQAAVATVHAKSAKENSKTWSWSHLVVCITTLVVPVPHFWSISKFYLSDRSRKSNYCFGSFRSEGVCKILFVTFSLFVLPINYSAASL